MSTRGGVGGLSAQQQQPSAVQNFKPKSEWKHEEQTSLLLVYLPGFAVDQLTITPDYSNGKIRIEGKRRLPDNRMLPVDETFDIPQHLDLSKMDKQFERGIIMLKIPINSDLQSPSQQESAVDDTPKLDPETPAIDPLKQKQSADIAAAPAMDGTETAKPDEGKSAGNGKRQRPGTRSAVKKNSDGVKDDGGKEQRKDSATKVARFEERVRGNNGTVKEDSALMVNIGIAAFVLMGLGASLLYTLGH